MRATICRIASLQSIGGKGSSASRERNSRNSNRAAVGGFPAVFSCCALRMSWRRVWAFARSLCRNSAASAVSPRSSKAARQASTRCWPAESPLAAAWISSTAAVSSVWSIRRSNLATYSSCLFRAPWDRICLACSIASRTSASSGSDCNCAGRSSIRSEARDFLASASRLSWLLLTRISSSFRRSGAWYPGFPVGNALSGTA